MYLENKDLKIWYQLPKTVWGYSLQAVIKMKIIPQHFQWILCVALS